MSDTLNKCDCEKCDLKGLFYGNVEEKLDRHVCSTKVENEYKKGDAILEAGKTY